jgi:hypothetical protein
MTIYVLNPAPVVLETLNGGQGSAYSGGSSTNHDDIDFSKYGVFFWVSIIVLMQTSLIYEDILAKLSLKLQITLAKHHYFIR